MIQEGEGNLRVRLNGREGRGCARPEELASLGRLQGVAKRMMPDFMETSRKERDLRGGVGWEVVELSSEGTWPALKPLGEKELWD